MSLYLGNTPICGGIEGNQLNNPFSLLDYKYSEYELSNASWLLSNGQWNSGAVYQSVYNLLLQIYNGTVTKAGVSVKLSTETYADTDFVLNTTNTTFRLPLKVKLPNSKGVAGNGKTLGFTDGTSSSGIGNISGSGFASRGNPGDVVGQAITSQAISYTMSGIVTDASISGIEVKDDSSIYLYFYVGETVQDANIIAAGQALTDIADLKAHSIVETYVNGTSWYRVYSDGWCEQGGITGSDISTIQLLQSFTNTNYIVFGNVIGVSTNEAAYTGQVTIYTKTKTSFSFPASSSYKRQWQACGYIS